MQLIDSDVFQCIRCVILPESGILRTNKQVIQHLIVRHQDIGRRIKQCLMICDDVVFAHHTARSMLTATHIHANSHVSPKLWAFVNKTCYTSCLIRRQRIHRINNEGFNAILSTMLITVFQNRVQKTLRLTGTCSCCDQSGLSIISSQSLKSCILVHIREVCRMDCLKAVRHLLCHPERKTHRYIGFMINRILCLQHISYRAPERLIRHRECGFYIVPDSFL